MSVKVVYNIPLDLLEKYRGKSVIVRTYETKKLVSLVKADDLDNLKRVQMMTLNADLGVFTSWGSGIPVDLIMYEPEAEFVKLYQAAKLLENRPIRVTIPVRTGFVKAVKVASFLSIPVKIVVGQPMSHELSQLYEVLDLFLHDSEQAQPVELFRASLMSFFRKDSNTVWAIQEEDPSRVRYIGTNGKETMPPRFGDHESTFRRFSANFVEEHIAKLLKERHECLRCEFADHCKGYFKLPNKDYLCSGGVTEIFRRLSNAADELHNDLAEYQRFVADNNDDSRLLFTDTIIED